MASAIGTALISTILQPMLAKAKNIIKNKGLDKAMDIIIDKGSMEDKARDKVMDTPMDRAVAMVVDKGDGIVNIERDISNLQITLRMIESIVRVAEQKQIDDDFIRNWLRDLVDIAYEARDVLDDFITFSSCIITAGEASNPVNTISSFMLSYFGGSSSDTSNIPLTVLNRLAKDIRSVRERFDETFATSKSVVGEGSESGEHRRPEVGPFINKQRDGPVLGREKVKEGIMEKIIVPKYDRVDVVVIWGMGGIGKTTLAQSIYNDEKVNIYYPTKNRKWLCVGESKFCAEKVIREILNEKQTIGIENLQTKLVEEFRGKQVQRFLIVLDDVWDVEGKEWKLLFNPLTNVGKGGLIIITRRERQLCDEITIQTEYNLEPLSEEDSWSIFERCAYVDGKSDTTPDLKGIGKDIVKKLNGLPLALKVVGGSLLNKDYSTWTDFLESKFSEDNEVMSALRWSYNHLPPHLKMCFTYCSLFPEDHVFDKKVLVEMWMAHDLIKREKQKRPEDVGAQYFEQLLNASLLQCIDGKHVMHDLIHDLALIVSNEEFANLTNDQMETVRHITITSGEYSKVPRLCKIEKLLTLYTIWSYENYKRYSAVDDVFKKLKSIRVLVLVSYKITDIPDCISELRHLRYLDVSGTKVQSLPDSLCHLYNLQMLAAPKYHKSLDYKSSYHEFSYYKSYVKLPIDIVNISSLRYVRASLSTCKGVGNLTSLQELSCIDVCEGDNIRELGDMQILRGKFTIRGLGNVEKLEDDVGALMDKQTLIDGLVLEFYKQLESTISEEVLDGCPPNLTDLMMKKQTLVDELELEFNQDSAQVLDALGCPPNLTYLRIAGYNGLKLPSWMVSVLPVVKNRTSIMNAANFKKSLSRLEIRDCDALKRLQLDALVSLKELKISNCSSLVQITSAICESLEISYCRLLEKMDVARCDSLKVVIKILKLYRCESFRSLSIDIHGLDSLEDLIITGCPKLELAFEEGSSSPSSSGNSVAVPIHYISTDNTQVFRTFPHHELVSLESLEIENLGGFENFDETEANNFCKLRSLMGLRISQCRDLKSLPQDFHKLSSLEKLNIKDCPQLQSLPPDFHKLSSLKSLTINSCPQLQSLPTDFHKLSSLEELYINNCPQLQSLPPDFHKLSSLEKLSIEECLQLQSLPADGLPPSLTYLCIMDCPLLYERCKNKSGLDWHKINHISYRDIWMLRYWHKINHNSNREALSM